MEYGSSSHGNDPSFSPTSLSPSITLSSVSSEVGTPVHSERASATTSAFSSSFPWESTSSQMLDTTAGIHVCPFCNGTDFAFSGKSLLSGSVTFDKGRASSVEYWQNITKNLSIENEKLRKQLAFFQQCKGVPVQEEFTKRFVEKLQDFPAFESITDPSTLDTQEPDSAKSSIEKSLSWPPFDQMGVSEGLEKNFVMELSEMESNEHFRGLGRLDAVEVLERTNNIEILLQMVLKDVPVIISHCDKELIYTYVKFVDQPLTKVPPEGMKGKKDTELVGLLPGALETMRIKKEVLESGLAQGKELTVSMDGFGKRWLVVACEPLRNKAGHVLGVITACMDVTEQALARERLAQMREEMAVREATEKELRRAIRLADEAMEAKNRFLAVMSHEIRTPLNGVLGMAQVLATTPLDPEQRELVSAMVFSADVLLAIISDILDLSKVEAGTMKLEERELNPRDIVKHVVRTAIVACKDRGITIQADIGDDVPSVVYGDPLRIKQVITNLVFNAVKFTRRGHVKVRLHVAKFSMDASKIDLHHRVSDSLVQTNKLEGIEGSRGKTESSSPDILSEMSSLLGLGLGPNRDEENWDLLMEGGRRDLPEVRMIEYGTTEMDDTTQEALHNKSRLKMHSVGDLFQAGNEDVRLPSESDQQMNKTSDQALIDFWLKFEIEDTGIGIPKEALPTLFEKFTLVHSSTTRKYGGTGLGLAICKQLVELMDGHISVISKEGKGSTFTFTLRCKSLPMTLGSPGPAKMVSETKMKENLSHLTANMHKLQAGMWNPTKLETNFLNFQSYQGLDDDPVTRRIAVVDAASNRVPTKLPRGSLKVRITNDSDCSELFGSSLEKVRLWEQELDSHTASWAAHQGLWKENGCRDRGGVDRGLRRTSSGPSRIECLMMADSDHSKSLPSTSTVSGANDKKLPSLLLAEDNKVNVMVALSMLKKLGLSADVASNGMEAIKAMQTKHYDLVLMDICMPVLDGLEVTRRIRRYEELGYWDEESALKPSDLYSDSSGAFEELPLKISRKGFPSFIRDGAEKVKRMPIIAMTANALSDCEKQCSATGMDSFMTKPVTFKKLKDVLALYLPPNTSLPSP
ncbi:histidine kinase 5 isoform X3 [Physcomitrium patens]|nr:histidine kinase 5-like isoform X3 [Physcomitrium patens]|eukprot:XP_024394363.1 histidine kinase 5-like isoform X3 [Physcomitrella patens]